MTFDHERYEPSPGCWSAPEGLRAGDDWIPEGGVTERCDRVPRWVRVWRILPVATARRGAWLWEHGGYDVETAAAATERERATDQFHQRERFMRHALDADTSWPSVSTSLGGPLEAIDVDRYDRFAMVVAAAEEEQPGVASMLRESLFECRDHHWDSVGGGGGGSGSDVLSDRPRGGPPLTISGKGWLVLNPERRRGGGLNSANVRCSSRVVTVVVERPGQTRRASVSGGSGWIGIVWPDGAAPTARAFDAAGTEVAALTPSNFAMKSWNTPLWRRLRLRRRRGFSRYPR